MTTIDTTIHGLGPVVKEKKSYLDSAKSLIIAHKKSCIAACVAIVAVSALLMIVVYQAPDSFIGRHVPWSSPDVKLTKKNNTDKARRSDSKVDNWTKEDYKKSVSKFNDMASRV